MKKTFAAVVGVLIFCACSNNDKKDGGAKTDTLKPVRTNTVAAEKPKESSGAEKPGIINILDSISPKRIVLYMKDSAKTMDRVSLKLGNIYGVKLADVLKKNGIK